MKIQSLDLKHRSPKEEDALRKDIEIFDKLAMLDSKNKKGKTIINNSNIIYNWIKLIVKDLGLYMDEKISLTYNVNHYYHLDLSLTSYTDDEKANIYYIFNGIKQFRPGYSLNVHVAGDEFANSYKFNGIGSYWLPSENIFFKKVFKKIEIEDQKPFADSFHILAMFYLTLNGYLNYQDASKNSFKVRNAS